MWQLGQKRNCLRNDGVMKQKKEQVKERKDNTKGHFGSAFNYCISVFVQDSQSVFFLPPAVCWFRKLTADVWLNVGVSLCGERYSVVCCF